MGTIRVTQGLMVQRSLRNIAASQERIFDLQHRLGTGRKVNAPSDDPIAMQRASTTRSSMARNEQFSKNIGNAGPLLVETGSTIQTMVDSMHRVRELTLQASTGTQGQPQLDAIAEEVDQLLEETVVLSNKQTNGRHIFAGSRTGSPAFSVERDGSTGEIESVTYDGNSEAVQTRISEGVRITVNETGDQVFQEKQDVFETLIHIRDSMRNGDQDALRNESLGELEAVQEQLLTALSRVGAIENRLERVGEDTEDFNLQYQQLLSDTIDADFAETIIELNAQTNAFESALMAGARVIQPSLLDFLR